MANLPDPPTQGDSRMKMSIPLGVTAPGTADTLLLVQSATLVVVFADGTHQSIVVTGPAIGWVAVDRTEAYLFSDSADPVAVLPTRGTDVTFKFENARHVKSGHA